MHNILKFFLRLSPAVYAVAILLAALMLTFLQGTLSLQNDDFQIFFMLCGGGTEPAPFALYTNVCLGSTISGLSSVFPCVNWYLCFLFLLAVASCTSLNFTICHRMAQVPAAARFAACLLLLYADYACLTSMQYTHVAVSAACAGALLVSEVLSGRFSGWRIAACAGLIFGAFCLRTSSILPAIFLLAGIMVAQFGDLFSAKRWKHTAVALGIPASLCGIAFVVNSVTYSQHPEWNDALHFLQARVQIVDSKDNSGLDKDADLETAGISPAAFQRFKQFIYEPEMDSLPNVEKALQIHKEGRKGVLGSTDAANVGLLKFDFSSIKPKGTILQFITPYVPLLAAIVLVFFVPERRRIRSAVLFLVPVLCYLLILAFLGRMVGRVLNPVLYAAGVYIASMQAAPRIHAAKWQAGSAILTSLLACAFCFRHYSLGALFKKGEGDSPLAYCKQHPDTLFLTCCQQGCGLFPTGFTGYTYDYLQKTNIFPIADGWMFYTPAYKSAMQRRGIANPYVTLLDGHTCVVVYKPWDPPATLNAVSTQVKHHTGQEISFRKVHECGVFEFWEPELCATGCP